MNRRQALLLAAGGTAGVIVGSAARAAPDRLAFAVYRKGDKLGTHVIDFTRDGDSVRTQIAIDISVTIAFIPVYSYRHRNHELWQGGRLISFSSQTDDNGEKHTVEARRQGDVIDVRTEARRFQIPGDVPPTTWWYRPAVTAGRWLDTQRGDLLTATVRSLGATPVQTTRGEITADQFRLAGGIDMDIWYAGAVWAGMLFKGRDGSTIEYRLQTPLPAAVAGAG